ncbi:MAG: type II toxin-antitoxin system VapC family toxin [Burkholderiaceae bacterium]|nr:type II toxin-antitoxin system VapC family toxin [Burkholderiaceae bacterium]
MLARAYLLYLNSIVLGELLAGFAAGTRDASNRAQLSRFLASPRVVVLNVTDETADRYALVYASLRRKRQPMPTNDLWIAASALERGVALLTLDERFARVDGLRVGRRAGDLRPSMFEQTPRRWPAGFGAHRQVDVNEDRSGRETRRASAVALSFR